MLVVVNGGAVAIDAYVEKSAAIVEAFYPNQAGAAALGPAFFGDSNRWGKLPLTLYPASYASQLTIEDMEMRANETTGYPGRSYRYYTGDALFEFGDGLSYTTFETACSSNETDINVTAAKITCTVTNTGSRAGDEVVMLFHRPPVASHGQKQRPIRRLLDFERLSIDAGVMEQVIFVVNASSLALPSEEGSGAKTPSVFSGTHFLEVRSSGARGQIEWAVSNVSNAAVAGAAGAEPRA